MSQSKFKIKVGDNIVFLGETNFNFQKNKTYKVINISDFYDYPWTTYTPFKEKLETEFKVKNIQVITINDKNKKTFFIIFTEKGFYVDNIQSGFDDGIKVPNIGFDKFTIERKLRKEKLDKINEKNY